MWCGQSDSSLSKAAAQPEPHGSIREWGAWALEVKAAAVARRENKPGDSADFELAGSVGVMWLHLFQQGCIAC